MAAETPTLEDAALALLTGNTRTVEHAGRLFRYSLPSSPSYPFQWFWDSCFHAIVWARSDWRRAAEELAGLLAWQRTDGMIPHVVFWDRSAISRFALWHHLEGDGNGILSGPPPWTTAMIQPPVIAQAVERIAAAGGGDDYVREVLPALERFHRYLARERDPDGDGLLSIVCQFESGLDFSPAYRPGRTAASVFLRARWIELRNKRAGYDLERIFARDDHLEDVLVNAVYGQALRALARLATRVEQPELAAWAEAAAARVSAALLERAYDERTGLFQNLVGRRERRTTARTVLSLLPLVLEDLPAEVAARLVAHLTDPRRFWPLHPVPSVALDEPTFRRDSRLWGVRLIWRGPASMNTNWFLVHGLRLHGYDEVAGELAARSRELVRLGGFNEFYDPLDGRPVGAPRFGWATLAADLEARAPA